VPALPVAVHDRGWREAKSRCLRFDLGNRRGITDCAQGIGDPVWHEIRPVTLGFEIADEGANGRIAVTGHGTSWRCAPNSRLRNALPEVLYSGVGGSSRP